MSSPKATSYLGSARSSSATTATCWRTRPTPPAIASTRCRSRTCAPARCSNENDRAHRIGRVGHRQQDALLYHRRCSHEALRQVLPPRARHRQERLALRREGRAVRHRRGPLARQGDDLRSARTQDLERDSATSPADNPNGAIGRSFCRARPDHEYDVDHRDGLFYIRTNKGAKNFRVVTAPISDPSEKNWKEFIDHNPAVKVDGIDRSSPITSSSPNGKTGLKHLRVIDMKTQQVASHRVSRAGLRAVARRQSANSTRRPCVSTISRWSRPSRCSTTT